MLKSLVHDIRVGQVPAWPVLYLIALVGDVLSDHYAVVIKLGSVVIFSILIALWACCTYVIAPRIRDGERWTSLLMLGFWLWILFTVGAVGWELSLWWRFWR